MTSAWSHLHWGRASHAHGNEAELAALVAATREALATADGGAAAAADVDAALRAGGEEGLTDAQLRRWLAARGWDPARAAHDLAAHAAWRAGFVPAGRVLEAEVADSLGQGKLLACGLDRSGRAVLVFVGKNHIPRDTAQDQRFFCYCADAAIAMADPGRNPGGRVVFVFLAAGFGWANFDVAGLGMLFRMIHTHYVERLATMYIHGASAAFQLLYRVVEPFIDPETRKKVVLLPRGDAEAAAALARDVGDEAMPALLGGPAEARPPDQVWRELLQQGRWQHKGRPQEGREEQLVVALVAGEGAQPGTD